MTLLSLPDEMQFKKLVQEMADDLNCITTSMAIAVCTELQNRRLKFAARVLIAARCPHLLAKLDDYCPSPSRGWLNHIATRLSIRIVSSQTIDMLRRSTCDANHIRQFFLSKHRYFARRKKFIANMDETMLYSKRRYKVLTAGRNRPVRAEKSQLPHLTGVCTIFADGTTMKPMVILPQKKTLDAELEDLDAFFVRSESGWMNKYLFMVYCIMFICKVQEKRSQMNVFDAQVPFLLIVDGHPSRLSFLAVRLLSAFNIELLVLPGHTSHILQPLDVGIFSPLKAQFKKLFDMATIRYDQQGHMVINYVWNARELRYIMVRSFLDACSVSCTATNIENAFKATGIYPLDMNKPLASRYIVANGVPPARPNFVNDKVLTDPNVMMQVFQMEYGRPMQQQDWYFNLFVAMQSVLAWNGAYGQVLSRELHLLYPTAGGFQKIQLK